MSAIGALLAGKGISLALDGVIGGARAFFKQDALGRLLVLLHAEFGARADLGRDSFYCWRDGGELEDALRAVLGGQPAVEPFRSRLIDLVAPHLLRTQEEERAGLAAEIANAVFAAAPFAADGGNQALALVLARLERGYDRMVDAVGGAVGVEQSSLAQALVVGPLKFVGAAEDVAEAERLGEAGEHAAAAAVLVGVAGRLEQERLLHAADAIRERAAAHLAAAGTVDDAADLLVAVASGRIARGAGRMGARVVPVLRDLLDPSQAWLADGVEALAEWPERGDGAVQTLAAAADASAGRADHLEWVAAYVELLAVGERWQEVVDVVGELLDAPLDDGPILRIVLDGLDAATALRGPAASEDRWLEVLRWADADGSPGSQAVAWQRRGAALARAERVAAASDAYRRAMSAWAALPGYEEQAADAFFCLQAVAIINAKPVPDMDLRPMAWTVRGAADAPVAIADRLEREAMARRLERRLPDAMVGYLEAYLIHRRVGSLQGVLETGERLGELYAEAGEHGLALTFYLASGKTAEAAQLAANLPGDVVTAALDVDGPRWERAAALHVVAAVGRTLPEDFVAQIVQSVLDQAAQQPDAFVAPQPAAVARRALAAISLAVPEDMRPVVFERLQNYMTEGLIDQTKAAANALVLATRAGLVDARQALVERFIDDPYNSGIAWTWIGEQARDHEAVRTVLLDAAAQGIDAALEPLAAYGLIPKGELQDRVDAVTRRAAEVTTVERKKTPDGGESISVGMGMSLEGPAVVGRAADPEARGALVERMLEIVTSAEEPEANRSSAAGALFNLAPALDVEQARRVSDALAPLALGRYEPSQFDLDHAHPLSRFQVRFHTPNQLQVSAIGTLAQLLAKHPELDADPLRQATQGAMRSGSAAIVGAVFDAAARLPDLDLAPHAEDAFFHPEGHVRVQALGAWSAANQGLPKPGLIDVLVADGDPNVRLQLAAMAAVAGQDGRPVLDRLAADDHDAFVRAKAALLAREHRADAGA